MQKIKLNKTNMLLNTVSSDASPGILKTVRKFEKMILADAVSYTHLTLPTSDLV